MGRKSKADVRKKEILEHFYEVLKEIGFENASIAKIAKRMEVNPSLLIHYFKTKNDMVTDMVDYILGNFENAFANALEGIETPKDRLRVVIEMLFGAQWQDITDHSVFYSCYYLSTRDDKINLRFRKMYARFREFLGEEIPSWIEAGLIKNADPEEIKDSFIILNEGLTYYRGVHRDFEKYLQHGKLLKSMLIKTLEINLD